MKIFKKIILLICIILLANNTYSQPFTIDFSGELSGNSVDLNEVLVQNLTKNTSITLQSGFVLDLVSVLSINSVENSDFITYPNPFSDELSLNFYVENTSEVSVLVYDELGKNIISSSFTASLGNNMLKFTAKNSGLYIIKVLGDGFSYQTKVICEGNSSNILSISRVGESNKQKSEFKSNPQLLYDLGDQLLITGNCSFSDNDYITIQTATPTQDESYLFDFQMCIDYDDNVYPVVHIGNQWWMAKNLKTTHYANGNSVTSYVYDNNSSNENIYGRLYPWSEMMNGADGTNNNPSGVQGICPDGWHVPSESEWDELRDELGDWEQMNLKVKTTGISYWNAPNDGTNESGMSVLPGGIRWGDDGTFDYLGAQGFFWNTSDYEDLENASGYTFFSETPSASYYIYTYNPKTMAQSVRCVMD